jgi:hypothetical protein
MNTSPLIDDPDNLVVGDMQQIGFHTKHCFHLTIALDRIERLGELTVAEIESSFDRFFSPVQKSRRGIN